MERYILKFCHMLRETGLKVSLSEIDDCLNSLKLTGLEKPVFYHVLRSTLVKDKAYFKTFDRVFKLYFETNFLLDKEQRNSLGLKELNREKRLGENILEQPLLRGEGECQKKGVGQGAGNVGSYQERFVQLIRLGDEELYRGYMEEGIKSLGDLDKYHLNNMEDAIRKIKVFLEWNMGVNQVLKDAEKEDKNCWWTWQGRIEKMEEILKLALDQALVVKLGEEAMLKILERENLNEIDFYQLSKNQIEEMKKKVTKLGHQLASRISFKMGRAKKGRILMQKTMRRSINTGGVPISPAFKDRIPSKPEIWVLCDISGSVKKFTEFMLQLMYSVQSRFLHVRSFVFVDTIAEVSTCFQDKEINEGIAEIYNKLKFSKTGFSDYGQVFTEFCHNYINQVSKKTTLLIIGDARNNYKSDQLEYLMNMGEEVKKIIWLNPEPWERWNKDDSIIDTYLTCCDSIFECRNLRQLSIAARKII